MLLSASIWLTWLLRNYPIRQKKKPGGPRPKLDPPYEAQKPTVEDDPNTRSSPPGCLTLPVPCRHGGGLTKHTNTRTRTRHNQQLPRHPDRHGWRSEKGRADWEWLSTVEPEMADVYLKGLSEERERERSTSIPGRSYLKTFVWGKSNKMDLAGQPKTKGAWDFQNGQKCICKVPLRNWQKRTMLNSVGQKKKKKRLWLEL